MSTTTTTVLGIGNRTALNRVARRMRARLDDTYPATARGFQTLRKRLRTASSPEETTVIVAIQDALPPEELVVELLRTEVTGIGLVDEGERDALESILSSHGTTSGVSDRAHKIRATMARKAMRGLVLGRIPYGYQAGVDGSLEEASEEARVVREIFRLAGEGRGIRAIVKELNARELRTRRGGPWSMTTVRDMLRNRVYTGTYNRFGSRVTGNHLALVSTEAFRAIQERMDSMAQRSGHAVGAPFLLSGMAVCGACGSRMIGVTRRQAWRRADGTRASNTYRYYQCEAATNQSRCSYHTHRASELDEEALLRLGLEGIASGASTALDARLASMARDAMTGRRTVEELRGEAWPLLHAADHLQESLRSDGSPRQEALTALLEATEGDPALRSLLRNVLQMRIERVAVEQTGIEVVMRP